MDEKIIELESVMELLDGRRFAELRELLREANPIDVAQLLGEVPDEKLLLLYRLLPKEDAADVFSEMEHEEQETLIRAFNDREIREVLDEMYIDDAVASCSCRMPRSRRRSSKSSDLATCRSAWRRRSTPSRTILRCSAHRRISRSTYAT